MSKTQMSKASRKPILLTAARRVSVLHRWLGVALCLMVSIWLFTGSVLSFVPFPSLGSGERIGGQESIVVGELRIDPVDALRAAGPSFVDRFRLISVGGRPRYLISHGEEPVAAVDGQTGEVLGLIEAHTAALVAERFFDGKALGIEGPLDLDQWTVHDPYVAYRPFYRVTMSDAAGTVLYVSARSGEVVQRTRRFERTWNYLGAVTHWINIVPLRANYPLWRRVIWTVALGGMVLISAGLFLGIVRYANLKRLRRPGLSPFSGWLRWHHSVGLFAGVFVLSWVSTGWLSLDIGTFFSSPKPTTNHVERVRGMSLLQAVQSFPVSRIETLGPAREIEFAALNAQPLLLLRDRHPQSSRVVLVDADQKLHSAGSVPDEVVLAAVQSAWSPLRVTELRHIAADDAYSLRRNPLPLTTRRVVLDDASKTWVQIDAATGQIISVLDRSRRFYRWVVDGLHTFDFPLLNRTGSLWHVLLLIGTTSGFALSCTGVVLGFRRLRKSYGEMKPRQLVADQH
jgi:uncharacterized iron-regulated membrane protein